jgi:hypothetical protein
MTWRALMFAAGFLLTSVAHAQQCTPHFTKTQRCQDENDFAKLVCNMGAYDPKDFNPHVTPDSKYRSPACDSGNPNLPHLDVLKDAYRLAPTSIKTALCHLKNVFVTTAGPAMGIWEAPGRGGGNVFAVIPEETLKSAKSLADEENAVLGRLLLSETSSSYPDGRALPTFQNASAQTSTPAAAVLAVLAHELGHIILADTNADGTGGGGFKHPRPCSAPATSCFDVDFLELTATDRRWHADAFHRKMRRWIAFGDDNGNTHRNAGVDFLKIKSDAASSNDVNTTSRVHAIYNGEFVSLFAAVSPEEDFVETYKYIALAEADGMALDLNVTFPGYTGVMDVLHTVRNPSGDLHRKIRCVKRIVASSLR